MNNIGQNNNYFKSWQFIEDYLPNYYHRNDILRDDILQRFVNGDEVCHSDLVWIEKEFQSDKKLVAEELARLETDFANEALEVYNERRHQINSNSVAYHSPEPTEDYVGKVSYFESGQGTNFIYEVVLPEGRTMDCEEFNRCTYPISGRLTARLKSLVEDYNATIEFRGVQSRCLAQNLEAIDGHMPQLLAQLLLISATSGHAKIKKCTELLTGQNPLGFDTQTHGNIYEYKVKRFLQDCAQGMTPETPWLGIYDATGGQIIVKENGDIVCYHIYELNRFRDYLYNSTKFERASTSEDENNPGYPRTNAKKNYNYGWLYEEDGHYFIKINLQVRSI